MNHKLVEQLQSGLSDIEPRFKALQAMTSALKQGLRLALQEKIDACRDLFFLVSARLGEQADALDYTMLVPRKFHPGQHHAPHLINHPH